MTGAIDYKASAFPWAARIAEAYRTADGAALGSSDQKTLASYVVDNLVTCLILHIPATEWGYLQVNPAIGVWEGVMRLRRGFRLLSADEGAQTVMMGFDPKAR